MFLDNSVDRSKLIKLFNETNLVFTIQKNNLKCFTNPSFFKFSFFQDPNKFAIFHESNIS